MGNAKIFLYLYTQTNFLLILQRLGRVPCSSLMGLWHVRLLFKR